MNQDKDFLGKEPIGKLLLKLALPTVTAQIINMLYNIVDRIYIGHIPKEGAMALTGVGVCMPLIMIVSAFAAFVGFGGAPRVCGEDPWKLFYHPDHYLRASHRRPSDLEPGFPHGIRRQRKYD